MQENMKVRGKALREKERRATLSFPARHLAWENSWLLATTGFPAKWRLSEKQVQKFHTDDVSLLRSG